MSTENLKKELEAALLITDWSPTVSDLREISRRIKSLKGTVSRTDIETIVCDVVDSCEYGVMEGVDNTDLTTLLLMATRTNSK
ncbi:MAG: hypothetical protein Q8K97_13130 [Pseudohongiella sp.]|nr:hypothetical protein [Pseudohongiella sp.]